MDNANDMYQVVGEGHEPIEATKSVLLKEAEELADYYTEAEQREEPLEVTERGDSIYIGDQEFARKI